MEAVQRNNSSAEAAYLDMFNANAPKAQAEEVVLIKMVDLVFLPDQPFIIDEEHVDMLVEDIRENGILTPLLVRPLDSGERQIISGRHRKLAAERLGYMTMPCIIRNLDEEQSVSAMIMENIGHRELKHSEKAIAYKLLAETMKKKAGRPKKNNLVQIEPNYSNQSREQLSRQTGENKTMITRYIRLASLIRPLLDMVDEDTLSFNAGYNIAFLEESDQQVLLEFLGRHKKSVSVAQAERIKKLAEVSEESLEAVFGIKTSGSVSNWKPGKNTVAVLKNYSALYGDDDAGLALVIKEALDLYYNQKNQIEKVLD